MRHDDPTTIPHDPEPFRMKGSDVESLTKLLKAHAVPLSAVKANRLMLAMGLLEEATRESSTRPGVTKTYKRLTEAGLDYGVNEENPQSPDQTTPYYYKDSFGELGAALVAVDQAADQAADKAANTKG